MVSIRLLWPFARLLSQEPRALPILARLGVGFAEFGNPDTRLPHRMVMQALQESVDQLGDPTLGLRAGLQLDAGDFDVLEHAARAAPNLGEAMQVMARYFRIMNEAAEISTTVEGEVAIWRFAPRSDQPRPPASNDFAVASSIEFSRRNVSYYEPPLEIRFIHERPSYAAEYERIFKTKITFGAPHNTLVLKKSRLEVPMLRASPKMSAAFELQARNLLEKLQRREGITGRVREEVSEQFRTGSVSMQLASRRLAMSVATLRRRLEEEGTTFSAIVDDLRKQLAERYLRENAPTISEIAFLLGFSDVTAFGRAFKRWTGVSPSEYRTRPSA
jgi:AraC-like DNA-binding protein